MIDSLEQLSKLDSYRGECHLLIHAATLETTRGSTSLLPQVKYKDVHSLFTLLCPGCGIFKNYFVVICV